MRTFTAFVALALVANTVYAQPPPPLPVLQLQPPAPAPTGAVPPPPPQPPAPEVPTPAAQPPTPFGPLLPPPTAPVPIGGPPPAVPPPPKAMPPKASPPKPSAPEVPTPVVPIASPPPPGTPASSPPPPGTPLASPPPGVPAASPPPPVVASPPPPEGTPAVPQPTDADILNFALQLEYLEAEFYSWAVFGQGLNDSLSGGGPPSTGGQKANLTADYLAYATEIANDEIAHVAFLRSALGAAAVPRPAINIGSAFSDAANAALATNLSPAFDPYASNLFFLHGAFIFEDVGVTAYAGAVGALKNDTYKSVAGRIGDVEAYHASQVRTFLYQQKDVITPYNVTPTIILGAIVNLENTAGGVVAGENIVAADGTANIVPADTNSLAFVRTPAEVAKIVTLGSPTGKGGFLPNGFTGFQFIQSA